MHLLEKNFEVLFKKRQCFQHTKVSGKTLNLDITNIYRNVNNPVSIFVVFQENRSNNQLKDDSIFYHQNFRNL